MVKRIKFLVEKRLTSMMVLFDFLSRRIAPLRQHARVAWLYTGEDDASRLERDRGTDLDLKVPPSPPSCMPIFLDQTTRSKLLKDQVYVFEEQVRKFW
jgi:hypothetical protein